MSNDNDRAPHPVEHVQMPLGELTHDELEQLYLTVNPHYAPKHTSNFIASHPQALAAYNLWRTSGVLRLTVVLLLTLLIVTLTGVTLPVGREGSYSPSDAIPAIGLLALWVSYLFMGLKSKPALNNGGTVTGELSSPEFLAVEGILHRALHGDESALDTKLSIVSTGSTPYFALENINHSWYACPEQHLAAERLVANLLIVRQIDRAKQARSLQPSAVDQFNRDATTRLTQLQTVGLEDDIVAKARETVRVLGASERNMPAGSEHVIQTLRDDTIRTLDVITALSPETMRVELPSGMTALQEFTSILDASHDEAKRLTSLSQLSKADELSFLRRVQDQRLRRSSLNLDG